MLKMFLNPYFILGSVLLLAATFGAGVFTGKDLQKGKLLGQYEKAIEDLGEQARKALAGLTLEWEKEVEKARIEVEDWSLQNEIDADLINQLVVGQAGIRRDFRDFERTIVTTELGVCMLNDDAVRLLNNATRAANRSVNGATGGEPPDSGAAEARGGDGSM